MLVIFDVLKKEVYYLDSYGGDPYDDLKELIKVYVQFFFITIVNMKLLLHNLQILCYNFFFLYTTL